MDIINNIYDEEPLLSSADYPLRRLVPETELVRAEFLAQQNLISKDDEILDTSWIQESERYHHISDNQERELLDSIGCYFIYINKHNYIEKILFEKRVLENDPDNGFSFLSKETILKIIQNKKILTPTSKYKLIDILSFVVDIEPNKVKEFIEMDAFDSDLEKIFLKVLPIFNDIHIDKSIFVFHSINHLYFIFQEVQYSSNHRTTLKSILKQKENEENKKGSDKAASVDEILPIKEREPDKPTNKGTKKVRIVDNIRELRKFSGKGRFTRKAF